MKKRTLSPKAGRRIVFVIIILSFVHVPSYGQQTCREQNEPSGQYSELWLCFPTYPGAIGSNVNINLEDADFVVPSGDRADFVFPLDHGITASPPIRYSVAGTWTTPVDPNTLRFDDKGVSFLSQPEQVLVAAFTDSAEPTLSDGFSWNLDSNGMAVGWTISDKQLSALPEEFRFIDHYHATIRGLPEGERVSIEKSVAGGSVVRSNESNLDGRLIYDSFGDGSASDLNPLTYEITQPGRGEMRVINGDLEFASRDSGSGLRMFDRDGPLPDTDGWSFRAEFTFDGLHDGVSSGFGGVGMAGSGRRWAIVTASQTGAVSFSIGPNGPTERLERDSAIGEEFVVQLDAFGDTLVGHLWRPDSPTDVVTVDVRNDVRSISPRFASGRADMRYHSVWFSSEPIRLPTGFEAQGDMNGNEILDVGDLSLISRSIANATNQAQFDLNDDGAVDGEDQSIWVKEYFQSWIGDANLDGEFNSRDFVAAFEAGKYEVDATAFWSEGDWNGDSRFDSGDFVVAFQDGGYEAGQVTDVAAVPEPSSCLLLLMASIGSMRVFRSARPSPSVDSRGRRNV